MKIILLGCGTSSGVPRIGNDWGDCDPRNPRNRRTRASIMVEADGYRVLVDTGPDMREQLLANGIGHVDAVIYTHDHADHTHGIDDLRQIYHVKHRPIDVYARADTLNRLKMRFEYAFFGKDGYPPSVRGHELADQIRLGPLAISVTDLPHGNITSAGIRFDHGSVSAIYTTDFNALPDNAERLFKGASLWVVDALRRKPHPSHPHLAQTLEWISRVRPRQAVLTHMDQSMDYASLVEELPPGVEPGYDGMMIIVK